MAAVKIKKFDQRKIEDILKRENQFISNLFSILVLPQNNQNNEESGKDIPTKKPHLVKDKTTRATSLVELQNRIEKLKNKGKATYKDKLQKKNLKNKLKKKVKQEKRNAVKKQIRTAKLDTKPLEAHDESKANINKGKPMFNKDGKMVFSKIGFTGLGKEKCRKTEKNPKKILEQVQQVNNKVQKLKEVGETEKAVEIKDKIAWKNALAKAQGIKVKDDEVLLKKSIQKMGQKKRSSKKKWEARLEGVKKAKAEKQKKRIENIEERKKNKKLSKLKKAAKKGKIIPGF